MWNSEINCLNTKILIQIPDIRLTSINLKFFTILRAVTKLPK